MKELINKNSITLAFIIIIFLLLVFTITRPILNPTGNAVYIEAPVCIEDIDCQQGTVCCTFYGSAKGACDFEENCPQISEATKNQMQKIEIQSKASSAVYWVAAALLFAVLVVAFLFYRAIRK